MKKLPTISKLYSLVRTVKTHISDDCRAFEEDEKPGIQLTIGWNSETGDWAYQTGDNSFMGSAYSYPIWAVTGVYRSSNCRAVARDLQDQFDSQTCVTDTHTLKFLLCDVSGET